MMLEISDSTAQTKLRNVFTYVSCYLRHIWEVTCFMSSQGLKLIDPKQMLYGISSSLELWIKWGA